MIEILAPAGNKQNLIQAVNSGADAVYLGLKNFSARQSADNFNDDELKYSIAYAKTFGVKVYVTINTLIKDSEIENLLSSVKFAYENGADAFIVQDIFLGKLLKEFIPEITLHLSTQAGVCNVYGAEMAKKYGFSRVILARETKLEDIKKISSIIETEVFVQGALCTSLSGHCYFSSFIGGNSGNRGACKQPCRKLYSYKDGEKTLNNGFVLSLSDLCLYERIDVLKDLGVKSFKIEGRMRSEEYVAVSVQFYKSAVNGKFRPDLFKALKSIYNRGDYTEGLAFNQSKTFISDKIQNHKGLLVGKVGKTFKDTFLFESYYNYEEGDCFKILRNGREIGNSICVKENGKLLLKFKGNILKGDDVYITKDVSVIKKYLMPNLKKKITVSVCAKVGEKLTLCCNGIVVTSDNVLEKAKSLPITKESIISNLNKTDVYPFDVSLGNIIIEGEPFIVSSTLNKLRAELYSKLFYIKTPINCDNIVKYENYSNFKYNDINNGFAVITDKKLTLQSKVTDVVICPTNYNLIDDLYNYYNQLKVKLWLYLPPFLSGNDLNIIDKYVNKFYGIYGDSYWCLEYATAKNVKLFAGVGFNVFNSYDVYTLYQNEVKNITISKELKASEISNFNYKLYALTRGSIEVMDLIYCPFSKDCKTCSINNEFTLVDTEKREFPVFRYKTTECRFKVFNSAKIIFTLNNVNNLYDLRCLTNSEIESIFNILDEKTLKSVIKNYTSGNYVRGVEWLVKKR